MSEDILSLWKDSINRTASFVCRDFPDVEKEDVRQELYVFVLKNQAKLKSPEYQGATTALTKAAKAYAWDQRKQHLQLSSQYSYRTSDIKAILESVFDARDWNSVSVPDDAKSEFNDVFLELNCDIKRAWESLGHSQKKIIFERYALGQSPEDAAGAKRLSRAIEKLTDTVNWYQKPPDRDYTGTRKAITNANARYILGNQGDDV